MTQKGRKIPFPRRWHGMTGTPTYNSWAGMRQRCLEPSHAAYGKYGGRGIKLDPRWLDFNNFLADMGERPSGMSIERIDNDGDYTPSNCKWATLEEQNWNKRSTRMLEYKGETKPLFIWAREFGQKFDLVRLRLDWGWPVDLALTLPPQRGRKPTRNTTDR